MTPLQRKLFQDRLRREREAREKRPLTADRPHVDSDPHVNVVIGDGCTRVYAPEEDED